MFGLIVNKGINSFSAYRYGVDEGNVHPTYFAWIEVWGGGGVVDEYRRLGVTTLC